MSYVYILHTASEQSIASKISELLRKARFDVWTLSHSDAENQEHAVEGAAALVVVMSKAAKKSKTFNELNEMAHNLKKIVIPLCTDDTILGTYQKQKRLKWGKDSEKDITNWLRLAVPRRDAEGTIVEIEDFNPTLTKLAKPKQLQDLAKALRSGLDSTKKSLP